MKIQRTMRPGDKGTQALVDEFGERLVCVRYRYDAPNRKRYTTVELIVGEGQWDPGPVVHDPDETLWIRVRWDEKELRTRVKEAGGRWDAARKLWELPAATVRELGLQGRVVPAGPSAARAGPQPAGGV